METVDKNARQEYFIDGTLNKLLSTMKMKKQPPTCPVLTKEGRRLDSYNKNITMHTLLAGNRGQGECRKRRNKVITVRRITLFSSVASLYLAYEVASIGLVLFHCWAPSVVRADFSDNCPSDCNCKWANGKREADCTRAGFTTIPTNLDHEIQILRMTHNYVRILGKDVFHDAGLINLQRIFMNHCHVQVNIMPNETQ